VHSVLLLGVTQGRASGLAFSSTLRESNLLHQTGFGKPKNSATESGNKPSTTLPGTVEEESSSHPTRISRNKAEIVLPDAEPFYQEIRIENTLEDQHGEEAGT
jgi:hypothetical protein